MRARELAATRKRLDLTQAALAKALGVHPMTVSRYETGQDPIPVLVALAVEALEYRARGTRKTA